MFVIPVPGDFQFSHSLSYLRRSPLELLHRCEQDHVRKAIRVGDQSVILDLRATRENAQTQGLEIRALNLRTTPRLRATITEYVRDWLDLDRDLTPFLRLARKDALLGKVVRQFPGCRLVSVPDLFECLVWAVIGQQINLAFAYRLKARFVKTYGETVRHADERYYLFPRPEKIVRIRPERLHRQQFSRSKIAYIQNIARAFVSGEISTESLQALSFADAHAKLTAIKGVGNWTANYALMRSLRRPEGYPREDVGLHNALKLLLGREAKPSLEEVDRFFASTAGYEAYTAWYLWRYLEDAS